MKLKETSFTNNVTTKRRGTPDWGAEIGQGNKKLMDAKGVDNILVGMLYYKADKAKIRAKLGKNSPVESIISKENETSIVLASLVNRVKVNDIELDGHKMIMFITRDEREFNENNQKNTQRFRRLLKFPISAEYDNNPYNQLCIKAISQTLGCGENGSWIVTDMYFVEDVLCLKAYVIDKEKPVDFKNGAERSETIDRLKFEEFMKSFQPSKYEGDLNPIILYGPPGTGKTHKMQKDYISMFAEENRFITTFHQSFSYEEFVEGLKPVLNGDDNDGDIKYQVEAGVFKKACERAANMAGYPTLNDCLEDDIKGRKDSINKAIEDKRIVLLCIDEINRGNVAAIFGDLISLIESSKRLGAKNEMTAMLPYSKKQFGVPGNLLIVGTMNTADRSIQLLDSALRRRFKFEELGPDYTVFGNSEVQKAAKAILGNMNAKIRCLLNKDNQIGHSYFMHAESYDDIYDALKNKIIPLLEEYFYNDVEKIRFVLSDLKKGDSFYVEDDEANNAYKSYAKDSFDDDNKKFYKLKEDRPQNCEAFLKHMTPAGENKDDVNE